jgi:hypothetical protein
VATGEEGSNIFRQKLQSFGMGFEFYVSLCWGAFSDNSQMPILTQVHGSLPHVIERLMLKNS